VQSQPPNQSFPAAVAQLAFGNATVPLNRVFIGPEKPHQKIPSKWFRSTSNYCGDTLTRNRNLIMAHWADEKGAESTPITSLSLTQVAAQCRTGRPPLKGDDTQR
jgi:hypothetical protein